MSGCAIGWQCPLDWPPSSSSARGRNPRRSPPGRGKGGPGPASCLKGDENLKNCESKGKQWEMTFRIEIIFYFYQVNWRVPWTPLRLVRRRWVVVSHSACARSPSTGTCTRRMYLIEEGAAASASHGLLLQLNSPGHTVILHHHLKWSSTFLNGGKFQMKWAKKWVQILTHHNFITFSYKCDTLLTSKLDRLSALH